ncbi:MAG: OmpW family protein [Burkholderiales bacterium]|jgi:outer membrane protein|nr:MAG: OmpW family protein [Burkholderiales bacterium]
MNALSLRARLIALAALTCAVAVPAHAGDFMVRARALYLDPANESTGTLDALGGVTVNSKYIWEVDASYFVTPNVAFELIATTPQKQTVSLNGSKIGTLRHLPPTLTVQYHFAPSNPTVRPYIGAGINYTHFSGVNLSLGGTPLEIDRNSWGTAVQFGADFPINNNLYFNVDFKKIDIRTDVTHPTLGNVGTVKIDPVLFGIGIGYRF